MITTRIQYSTIGFNLVSKPVIAYDGIHLVSIIERQSQRDYTLTIIDNNTLSILECVAEINNEQKAKKLARKLLINKYNVRLIEEIRGR